MSVTPECNAACEAIPRCVVCNRTKHPRGRDPGMLSDYCEHECAGHSQPPHAGHLWPGELERARLHVCPKCKCNDHMSIDYSGGYTVSCDHCYDGDAPFQGSSFDRAEAIALWNEAAAEAMGES